MRPPSGLLLLLALFGCQSPSGSSSDGFAEEPTGTIVFDWRPLPGDQHIYQVRPDGSGFAPLWVPHTLGERPEVSRDGRRLLYHYAGDLFVLDLATRAWGQVNTDWWGYGWSSWSPDGKRIVSVKRDDLGNHVLRVTEVDRSAVRTITPILYVGDMTQPAFFPSGDSVLYVKHDGISYLWLAYSDGRPPRVFSAPWGSQALTFALSRDGQQLAAAGFLVNADSGLFDDFTVRIATGPGRPVLTANFAPNWVEELSFSPDGKFLAVVVERPRTGITWLEVLEISTSRRRQITPESSIGEAPTGTAINAKWGP